MHGKLRVATVSYTINNYNTSVFNYSKTCSHFMWKNKAYPLLSPRGQQCKQKLHWSVSLSPDSYHTSLTSASTFGCVLISTVCASFEFNQYEFCILICRYL